MLTRERKVALPHIDTNIYGNDLLGKLVASSNQRFYNITDHLGSVRVVVKDSAGAPVDSWSDYYPFGKEARGSSSVNEPKEQFAGKERDAESGLDYFGARYYNREIGRFTSNDPHLDKYPSTTPYSYANNNPIFFIDPTGMDPGDYYDEDWNYMGSDGIDDQKVYKVGNVASTPAVDESLEGNGGESSVTYVGQVEDVFKAGDSYSDGKLQSLDPAIRGKAMEFMKDAKASDKTIKMSQGARTNEEQDELYAKGRKGDEIVDESKVVTSAKGGESYHNYGLAFDVAKVSKSGAVTYDLNWSNLKQIGSKYGFEWGGDWAKQDKPHFQNTQSKTIKDLKAAGK